MAKTEGTPTGSTAEDSGEGEVGKAQAVAEDVSSAPEEANESRLPNDPRDINEQQPPTATEY